MAPRARAASAARASTWPRSHRADTGGCSAAVAVRADCRTPCRRPPRPGVAKAALDDRLLVHVQLLRDQLSSIHPRKQALPLQELGMAALLGDPPSVEHDHAFR